MTELTLILGKSVRFKGYTGGKMVMLGTDGRTTKFEHQPAVHKKVLVTESAADGLIAREAKWRKSATDMKPEGLASRMFKVEDIRRNVSPDPPPGNLGRVGLIINALAEKLADALTAPSTKKSKA